MVVDSALDVALASAQHRIFPCGRVLWVFEWLLDDVSSVNHGVMRWRGDMQWMKEDLKHTFFFEAVLNSCSFALLPCPVWDLLSVVHRKGFSCLGKQVEETTPCKMWQFYLLLFD